MKPKITVLLIDSTDGNPSAIAEFAADSVCFAAGDACHFQIADKAERILALGMLAEAGYALEHEGARVSIDLSECDWEISVAAR